MSGDSDTQHTENKTRTGVTPKHIRKKFKSISALQFVFNILKVILKFVVKCVVTYLIHCLFHYLVKRKDLVKPKKKTVKVGDSMEFVCMSKKIAIWYFNNGSLPKNTFVSSDVKRRLNILRIVNAGIENEGVYTCHLEKTTNVYYEDKGKLNVEG